MKNFKQSQGFQKAMQAKRDEAAKVKEYYENWPWKEDLKMARKAYDDAIVRQEEVKGILPF